MVTPGASAPQLAGRIFIRRPLGRPLRPWRWWLRRPRRGPLRRALRGGCCLPAAGLAATTLAGLILAALRLRRAGGR
jgi:hypothetical protein